MISRENVPKDESRLKQDKLAKFEVLCSEVAPGICIGGEKVAADRQLLNASGITHIINCVGMIVPNYFPEHFTYHTLYLKGELLAVRMGLTKAMGELRSAMENDTATQFASLWVRGFTIDSSLIREFKENSRQQVFVLGSVAQSASAIYLLIFIVVVLLCSAL